MTEWGIDTLFNPGKRHLDEEKRRLQSTREEVGDASGGRRVDFTAGTVRINRSGAKESTDDTSDDAAAESKDDAATEGKEVDPVAEERQRRARERRARMAGGAAKNATAKHAAARDTVAEQPNPDSADEASS